ncbi:hypothetical protein C8Q79DRAFT_101500 [Trametes meyenii]|nr:hypothetical protein C8Q79DRAFT_101500 [Trametes meyenii]
MPRMSDSLWWSSRRSYGWNEWTVRGGGARRGSKTWIDGRTRELFLRSICPLNPAIDPLARALDARSFCPSLVDWFGLSRTPTIHEPGASVKVAHLTRVAQAARFFFLVRTLFLSRPPPTACACASAVLGWPPRSYRRIHRPLAPYFVMQCPSPSHDLHLSNCTHHHAFTHVLKCIYFPPSPCTVVPFSHADYALRAPIPSLISSIFPGLYPPRLSRVASYLPRCHGCWIFLSSLLHLFGARRTAVGSRRGRVGRERAPRLVRWWGCGRRARPVWAGGVR